MNSASGKSAGFVAIALALSLTSAHLLSQRFVSPFPPLAETLSTPINRLQDLLGITLGLRRQAADLAWIETLQYYGTHEAGQTDYEEDNGMGKYPLLLNYCRRTVLLDPHFTYVYYYGAGALGWNLNRLDEAEALLQEGIRLNPNEWRLHQYLAALSFQKNHDPQQIVNFLESFLYDPSCPNLLRNMLAHIYRKQGRYADAMRVLLYIDGTKDPVYGPTAEHEMLQILPLLRHNMGH